jgi:uncharacterized membrane protein
VAATPRGLDRLVTFADAVVAIAITLLVLPLVDLSDVHGSSVSHLLSEHVGQIATFLLSFAVIARLWMAHHRTFEHVRLYDRTLVPLTLVWLATIAFLPFPTGLLGAGTTRASVLLYIGTLLASSLVLTATIEWVHTHPALQVGPDEMEQLPPAHWAFPLLLVVALVVALVNPKAGLWALLLLLVSGPVDALILRLRGGRRSPAG